MRSRHDWVSQMLPAGSSSGGRPSMSQGCVGRVRGPPPRSALIWLPLCALTADAANRHRASGAAGTTVPLHPTRQAGHGRILGPDRCHGRCYGTFFFSTKGERDMLHKGRSLHVGRAFTWTAVEASDGALPHQICWTTPGNIRIEYRSPHCFFSCKVFVKFLNPLRRVLPLVTCEQDSGIGSHGATWAPANLGKQRTSGSVSSRARSPCAHEAASRASSEHLLCCRR